jgi:polyphosphate:AMP phosphotransferase
MLQDVDLSERLAKKEFKQVMPGLEIELGTLERRARRAGLQVVLVFEGFDGAGKGTLINRLIHAMDPRGFEVHSLRRLTKPERERPFLWPYAVRIPPRGRIGIFDRGWYRRVLEERVHRKVPKKTWSRAYEMINAFERQLTDDGALLVKFFLHIDKEEQARRLKVLDENPATTWRVKKADWKEHRQYERHVKAMDEVLARTGSEAAPWTVVAAHDQRHARVVLFRTLVEALSRRLSEGAPEASSAPEVEAGERGPGTERSRLDEADLGLSLDRGEYGRLLGECQKRIYELQHRLFRKGVPTVLVYQGWDAAGKGGNIRRLTASLDPRGYRVIPVGAPNEVEKAHHYLWRFWRALPRAGHMAIFDRSWYERVLTERVEELTAEPVWRRAYREIREFEAHLVHHGTVLLKFWIHIDPEEQLRRFRERESTPHKQWKITEEDWRNREKWDAYREAVEEMIRRTHRTEAPWHVVPGNSKLHARIFVLEKVVAAMEERD